MDEEKEHLHDRSSELKVRLVHLCTLPHVDLQVVPDQGEQGGGEGHAALFVYRHVHPGAGVKLATKKFLKNNMQEVGHQIILICFSHSLFICLSAY